MDDQLIDRAIEAAAEARSGEWAKENRTTWKWDDLRAEDQAQCVDWVTPIVTAALAEVEADIRADALRDVASEASQYVNVTKFLRDEADKIEQEGKA